MSRKFEEYITNLVDEGLKIEFESLAESLPLSKKVLVQNFEDIIKSYSKHFDSKISNEKENELEDIVTKNANLINEIVLANFDQQFKNFNDFDDFQEKFNDFKTNSKFFLNWKEFENNPKTMEIIDQIKSTDKARKREESLRREAKEREEKIRLEAKEREERIRREAEERMEMIRHEEKLKRERAAEEERRSRQASCFTSPPSTPSYNSFESSSPRATYVSNGSANGREVFTGPRGGSYYLNSSGNKQYVNKGSVRYS